MTLSPGAAALLERARQAEHAADLYMGAARVEPERLVELLRDVDAKGLDERTLWNVLFCAGEVSQRVDVYRAHDLFGAARALVHRSDEVDPERAAIIEMCFDFFFARRSPLVPLRGREVVTALGELLHGGSRASRRAAIHGLGHLVALGGEQPWVNDAIALLDSLAADSDLELRRYAEEARTGELP